ncbi:MAG: copper resistance protein CopD [Gemmatimonadales bacterium]|nr:copper resistance protein CopD [Gemmatimonadales bacterium]NIN11313.1 copper resistance protein CopD [Gemmatimonadales bacterium]NIN49912.1 copper resistance protein CopD [Gemmatimonadales bacterium]NIP07376.1 copper resistance protein CopD [Gemmatimonadales bacterium]NIR03071.1 copper resistance protein CopD [Gemmatimonadales bacterium]
MYKYLLLIHVLGATIWTGGHLVLALTVLPKALKTRNVEAIRQFESGYERIGMPALFVQVITGIWLAYRVLPDPAAWFSFGSHTSTHILLKLVALTLTLILAMHARLRIIPRLDERRLTLLGYHIVSVTILAVIFVILGVSFRTGGLL